MTQLKTLEDFEQEICTLEVKGTMRCSHCGKDKFKGSVDFYPKELLKLLKQEAIKHIKAIQSGSGVDRTEFPDTMKGSIVKKLWNRSDEFGIGIEYGFIIGLMTYLNITEEDLK